MIHDVIRVHHGQAACPRGQGGKVNARPKSMNILPYPNRCVGAQIYGYNQLFFLFFSVLFFSVLFCYVRIRNKLLYA
jgi:hypothetical protein